MFVEEGQQKRQATEMLNWSKVKRRELQLYERQQTNYAVFDFLQNVLSPYLISKSKGKCVLVSN
jgi:hypothetical protein